MAEEKCNLLYCWNPPWRYKKDTLSEKDSSTAKRISLTRKDIEKFVLVLIVAAVLGFFSIPIVIHIHSVVAENGKSRQISRVDTNEVNCTDRDTTNDLLNSTFAIEDPLLDGSISCGDGFFKMDGACMLSCYKFNQNEPAWSILMKVIVFWTGWFGFITGLIFLMIAIKQYKKIFTFPSVLLVYMDICYCIIEIFVILTSSVDQSQGLYCKHEEFFQSVSDPTLFCKISGIAFHYCIVGATLWWFFHVSTLFYRFLFPFRANKNEKYEKYIHFTMVSLGLLLPLPAIIYTLFKSKYTIVVFPPLLCLPENSDIFYYSAILVLDVLIALGVSMFILLFWVVHKHREMFKTTAAEVKLLFALSYYVIFGVATISYFQSALQHQTRFFVAVERYFECNYCQHFTETACSKHYFFQYTHTPKRAVSYIAMSLIPTALLTFIVNWKKVGDFLVHLLPYKCKHRSDVRSALSPISESKP